MVRRRDELNSHSLSSYMLDTMQSLLDYFIFDHRLRYIVLHPFYRHVILIACSTVHHPLGSVNVFRAVLL